MSLKTWEPNGRSIKAHRPTVDRSALSIARRNLAGAAKGIINNYMIINLPPAEDGQ